MSKYEKYLNTIDSGLEWLGQIPAHWNVQYSKWLFSERNKKALPSDEMLTASQKYGVIPQKLFMELEQQKVVQVLKGHDILKRVEQDDFVISMRSFQGGIEYCPYTGAVSSAYVPLEPQGNISRTYYKYLFKSKPYIQALQTTTNLVRDGQALRYNNFIQVRLPVPQIDEANNIGLFLDHETAKIDTLIEKQQQLIELLKEKRQAVISHAVTKGLNPDAPMKDSGVEWLGEVPEHWECKKLKHIATMKTEKSNNSENVIALENIESWSGKHIKTNSIFDGDGYSFSKNDILFNKLRPYLAKVFLCKTNGIAIGDLLVFEPHKNLNSKFAFYLMISPDFIKEVDSSTYGSKMPRASVDFIKEMPFLLPPAQEQIDIATFIERVTDKFNQLEIKAKNAIELMQERRTALISAAVTGKIDVRNWVVPTTNSDTNEAQQEVTA